jgi:hypothetical protein
MCKEGARDVPAPLMLGQPSLSRGPSCPPEERPHGKLPHRRELAREPLGGVVSALEPAVRIARNEHHAGGVRPRHRVAYDCRRPGCKPAQAPLLPSGDDQAQPIVVCQRSPSTDERELPAGTLHTALHGPGRRRAAAHAERRLDVAEPRCAVVAYLCSGARADEAALWQEQIEHVNTLGQRV